MENLEIILSDFSKDKIDKLVYEELKLSTLTVKSSHFYDNKLVKDIEFPQVKNLKDVLSPKGTGNIFIEELHLGISLKNVVIVFSFNEKCGDVVFNFPVTDVLNDKSRQNKIRFKELVNYLFNLRLKFDVSKVLLGYEPADDEDTLLIEINNNKINFFDKEIEKLIV